MEGITGVDDASLDRDLLPFQAVGITRTVPALVFGADDRAQRGEKRHRRQDALADHRVLAHDGELLGGEGPGLLQDVAGNPDLPDVVQQGAVLQEAALLTLQAEAFADLHGQLGRLP